MVFREDYNEHDLEAAIEHGISGDADKVKFSHYGESDNHIHLLESLGCGTSKLTHFPKGCAVGKDRKEIIENLCSINGTIKSYWEDILNGFESKLLPPVIVVNKKLCDGAHRTIICYLFNVPVRIAYFTAPPLE